MEEFIKIMIIVLCKYGIALEIWMLAEECRNILCDLYPSKFGAFNNAEFPFKFLTRQKIDFLSHHIVESKVNILRLKLHWIKNIQRFHCKKIAL